MTTALTGTCLQVNPSKTKNRNRKRCSVRQNENFFYNNEQLEIVNDFNYLGHGAILYIGPCLGLVFNYTCSFVLHNQYIIGKTLKA